MKDANAQITLLLQSFKVEVLHRLGGIDGGGGLPLPTKVESSVGQTTPWLESSSGGIWSQECGPVLAIYGEEAG